MTSATRTICIAIADDHAMVRSALQLVLERVEGINVVAIAADTDDAIAQVAAKRPDVLLLDLGMPGSLSSLAAIGRVRKVSRTTRVLVLTMHADAVFARAALKAGASGFVTKGLGQGALVDAIRRVVAGESVVDPAMDGRLTARMRSSRPALTARELDVVSLLALGHTNHEVARLLDLSVRTVESHRARIQRKLGYPTRAELVRYAREHGLMRA